VDARRDRGCHRHRVYEEMLTSFRDGGGSPGRGGHPLALAAEQVVVVARHRVAQLLNAERPEDVVFTLNATDALNIAIKGVLHDGGHAITTALEHNSVIRPLRGMEKRGQITLSVVPCGADTRVDPAEIAKHIRPNTRLIVMTHASNVTGALQPIAAVAKIARERGIVFLVDASQALGTVPILSVLAHTTSPWIAFWLILLALTVVSGYSAVNAVVKAELFPVEVRALGIGLPHALTVSVFGGTAEYVALKFKVIGHEPWFYWYVSVGIAVSLLVYLWMPETRKASCIDRDGIDRTGIDHDRDGRMHDTGG